MRIKTSYEMEPILSRDCDWSAIDDDTYDYDQPVGYGATEKDAIIDLLCKMDDKEEAIQQLEKSTHQPWKLSHYNHEDEYGKQLSSIDICTKDYSDLCEFFYSEKHTVDQNYKEALACANLMMHAPKLLKALRELLFDYNSETVSQAMNVINRAITLPEEE